MKIGHKRGSTGRDGTRRRRWIEALEDCRRRRARDADSRGTIQAYSKLYAVICNPHIIRILVARLRQGRTEQSLIIKGLRGVGKTVLLNAFEGQAEREGFLTYYHELTPGSNLIEDLARDAARALTVLDLGQRLLQQVRQAFAHTKTIRLTGPGELGLAVDLQKAFQSSPEPKLGCNAT